MKHICPVCGFDGLAEAAFDSRNEPSHEICPRCGFEFGFDGGNDKAVFEEFRQQWVKKGSKWFMPHKFKTHLLFLFLVFSSSVYAQDGNLQSNIDDRVIKMKTELNLNESQAVAIKPIIKEYISKRGEILENVEGQGIVDHVALKDTLNALKEMEYKKLRQILSEDQMQRWIQKENLRASLNQGEGSNQVEDDTTLTPEGANFKF